MNMNFAAVLGSECVIYYEAQITYLILTFYLPFFPMFVMSFVLIVICCKQRGKSSDKSFDKESLISCCACTIAYIALSSPEIVLKVLGFYSVFWVIAMFLYLCIPGMMCQLWLLISKEIRTSAFCKSPKTGEKEELIPKS